MAGAMTGERQPRDKPVLMANRLAAGGEHLMRRRVANEGGGVGEARAAGTRRGVRQGRHPVVAEEGATHGHAGNREGGLRAPPANQ